VHHPFAPNILQGAIAYDRSPHSSPAIINQSITQTPSTQVQGSSTDSHVVNQNEVSNSQCQKQSINDQSAINHRQMFMQMQQQKQATTNNRRQCDCPIFG